MPLGWVAAATAVSGIYSANQASKAAGKATAAQSAAAATQAELGYEELGLAREQWDDAKRRQAEFDPKFLEILNTQLDSMRTQDQRSAQQWQQYEDIFMPAERALGERSMNFDTTGRRNDAAAAARAAVETQAAQAREAQSRALGRAGVSLSSGRALTLDNASRLATSKAAAGADQGARRQVEATGLSLLDNMTKTGRGLTSTGLQAAGLALNAGNSATGTLGQQQATHNASMAPALGLYSNAANTNASAANIWGNVAQSHQQSAQNSMAGLAGLGQMAGTLGSASSGSVFGQWLGMKA